MLRKIASFVVKTFLAAKNYIRDFIVGVWTHAETIAVLTLASFGASALIGELPFLISLPAWFEQALIVPVLAVVGVSLLIKSAEWRAKRRLIRAVQ